MTTLETQLSDLLARHDEAVRADEALDASELEPTLATKWRARRAWEHYEEGLQLMRQRLRRLDQRLSTHAT